MANQLDIKDLLRNEKLLSELDYQRATIMDRKLRLLEKEDKKLVPLRKRLRELIKNYEKTHWADSDSISDQQIRESDTYAQIAEKERQFFEKRKHQIRERLKEKGLAQQDLGLILGHSKSYISELINGVSPFSLKDLLIIHRLLQIHFDDLIPPILQQEVVTRIKEALKALNKSGVKISAKDINLLEYR